MDRAEQTLADARTLIENPDHFSQQAYIRNANGNEIYLNGVGSRRGESSLSNWCKAVKPQMERPEVHQMCMVSAVIRAAPDEFVAAEALVMLGAAIESEAVDAAIKFKHEPHNYERFNNFNDDGHKGVLNLLAIASGKPELFIL